MRKSKLLVALGCMVLGIGLAACAKDSGNVGDDKQQATEKAETKDEYTFGYIAYDMKDIWNEYSAKAFEYAATKQDVKVKTVILDSQNSLEESVAEMESLIQQGVDCISIFPISTEQ